MDLAELIHLALIRPDAVERVMPIDPASTFDSKPIVLPAYSGRERRRRGVKVAQNRRKTPTGIRRYLV